MTKKLILHIGIHKTGTSAVQQFLYENRSELEAQGILYPILKRGFIDHNYLAWPLMDPKYRPPYGEIYRKNSSTKIWKRFFDLISKSSCEKILLSGEDFFLVKNPNELKEFLRNFEVRIIVYLRRQDLFLQSLYNQDVKNSYWMCDESFGEYVKNHRMNELMHYDRFLGEWASVFGKNALIVGVYEKSRLPNGLIPDFFSKAGIVHNTSYKSLSDIKNPSLAPSELELKRILNGIGLSPYENKRLLGAMEASRSSKGIPQTGEVYQGFTTSGRREFMDKFIVGNQSVAMEFFNENSDLFEEIETNGEITKTYKDVAFHLKDIAPLIKELLQLSKRQQDIIKKLNAENKYAGELWKKQQEWIKILEEKLKEANLPTESGES